MVLELVIASGKGGVGKSLVSAELILALQSKGFKVVGIDADADAPNLHLVLGGARWEVIKEYEEGMTAKIDYSKCSGCGECARVCQYRAVSFINGRYVINELLCEGCYTCSLVCPEKAVVRVKASTGTVRAGKSLVKGVRIAGAKLVPGRPNSGRLVTEVKSLARELWGGDVDVYVVDAAAGIGCQVIASLAGASAAILVAEPTPASLEDLRRVHRVVKHFGIPAALIINKSGLDREAEDRLIRYALTEGLDFLGRIPYDDAVPESMANLRPVTIYRPKSAAAEALRRVTEEVIDRIIRGWSEWRVKHAPRTPQPYVPEVIPPF